VKVAVDIAPTDMIREPIADKAQYIFGMIIGVLLPKYTELLT
jgi:hypothetical protein